MDIAKGDLFESEGFLKYSFEEEYGYKLIVEVDQGVSDFYRSLIPKWVETNRQKYPAHISVVRNEVPLILDNWGKYQGKAVQFTYSNYICNGTVYWWLNAFSSELEDIRLELGLEISSKYTLPPEGYLKCFHITLANMKGLFKI